MSLPRPHRDDVTIAAVWLFVGLVLWSLGLHARPAGPSLLGPVYMLVPLVVTAGLELVRRALPHTALLAGTIALAADQLTPGSIATVVMFADLVYAAVVYGTPAAARRIPVISGMITIGAFVGFLAWLREPAALLLGMVTALVVFAPATSGAVVRNHREAADAARLRAEQTALLAEMDRVQAVTAERARMARELHDVVANHLSAIAIHSTAALSLDDGATTRRALGVIRENSVEGLAEMRRLIGLLRDSGAGGAEPAATPTLAGLRSLVAQARVNGTPNGLSFELRQADDAGRRLPAPVELAAYRIVQESLTNALKHAAPGPVRVSVADGERALTVTVTSSFRPRPEPRAPGSRAGLVGMRERVALLDGDFRAGPEEAPGTGADGGPGRIWRVRAVLPVRGDDREPSAA
ncbi:histidine kinase [Streptomyces sp. C10-9-1]|uniref:sensor histidine kinase n=1 Tax=Streptomyces sp. C10-9-1 TaxID=1859285 RepID=UPI0021113324|nr:histidine kinase [Streptomyces sp. C10-9-1]MCQ6552773.1 histidine kinase [Streptomyces sp. C10-9-1]